MSTYLTADRNGPQRVDTPSMVRLLLHEELYLLAHDDDTGEPHLSEPSLALGLAGAILLELAINEQVAVGWAYNHDDHQWLPEPGRLTRTTFKPTGNPLTDAALAAIEHSAKTGLSDRRIREFLRIYGVSSLYQRVQAHLITIGLLQRTSRRRLAGLITTEANLPLDRGFAIRARARIRTAVAFHEGRSTYSDEQADDQCAALCGLIAVLGLAQFDVLSNTSARRYTELLHAIVKRYDDCAIDTIIAAVDAARGDLTVAAMR